MIEREFVDSYIAVCRDLELDGNESRLLWLEIVKQIERVEAQLPDPANATDEEIARLCDKLGVPTFEAMGREVRRRREQPAARAPLTNELSGIPIGAFSGFRAVTREDRSQVERLAPKFLAGV